MALRNCAFSLTINVVLQCSVLRNSTHSYFKHEFCSAILSYSVQLQIQNSRLILEHPLLLNVCHVTFAQFFVREYLFRYVHDQVSHFLPLNITSSVIDFVILMTHYQWRNRRRNADINMSALISCKLSVHIYSLWVEYCCGITNTIICVWLHQFWISATLNRQYLQKTKYRNFFCAGSFFRQPSSVTRSGDKIIDHSREDSCWLIFKSYTFLTWLFSYKICKEFIVQN